MEFRLLNIFAFVCGTMLAASVVAAGDSNRETASKCDHVCERYFPGQEDAARICKGECKKGNLQWFVPAKKATKRALGCIKQLRAGEGPEFCIDRYKSRCDKECGKRFLGSLLAFESLAKVLGSGNDLLLCRGGCAYKKRSVAGSRV